MTNELLTADGRATELARICPRHRTVSPSTDTAVDALVNQALAAHRQIEDWSEARIDALLHALGLVVADHAYPARGRSGRRNRDGQCS